MVLKCEWVFLNDSLKVQCILSFDVCYGEVRDFKMLFASTLIPSVFFLWDPFKVDCHHVVLIENNDDCLKLLIVTYV